MKRKTIEVEAMHGMNRRQVRITNNVANILFNHHHMCLDCAINAAVAFVIGSDRPEHEHNPSSTSFCSETCGNAMREFMEETLGCEPELVGQLPPSAH